MNIVKMSILTKAIYKFNACNPYQATNGIFHRTRTNNFTICTEIQKTLNNQRNLEKEEQNCQESTCLTSGSTTKPQSSRQYGTGTKTEI